MEAVLLMIAMVAAMVGQSRQHHLPSGLKHHFAAGKTYTLHVSCTVYLLSLSQHGRILWTVKQSKHEDMCV